MRNSFLKLLKIQHPIFQAPLAGGGDTPALVGAVSNAGGLGFIGAAYLNPDQIRAAGAAVRALTTSPFGINLFAPSATATATNDLERALGSVAPFYAELGLGNPPQPSAAQHSFGDQLAAALETGASVFSYTFGRLPAAAMRAIKDRGMHVVGTVTSVEEAIVLAQDGADAVIAQGSEAGGHRGTFLSDVGSGADVEYGMVGTMALVPQIADAINLPVIASGGIMDGRGIAAALTLGASAVQMGTAFLTCDESGASKAYRDAIFKANENQTRLTRAFSGRPARGIMNRFMTEIGKESPSPILPFPLQNALTRPLRIAAAKQDRAEFLSLWAGQGLRMARSQSAAHLMQKLVAETQDAFAQVGDKMNEHP